LSSGVSSPTSFGVGPIATSNESLPNGVTSDGLTRALLHCGALGEGRVSYVAVENARSTVLSRIFRLRLTYEEPAGDAPASLIFKTGLPERLNAAWSGGRQEVAFYANVASAMPAGSVPRCFEAHWDEQTKDWRLLLEDLTDSHFIATTWPLPPTFEECQRIIHARARFHAYWWDDPRLGASVGQWGDAEAVQAYLKRLEGRLSQFVDRMGDRLPRERRELYEAVLDRAPNLLARTDSRRNVTIVHGDAHTWNCFLPRDGGGDVRLFDWDGWRLGVATDDLAYMMAVHWYPDRRRRIERPLLDTYHSSLLELGVNGYDRSALDDDYRLSALWQIVTPVFQAGANIPTVIWWNNFERIFMAVDDLGCRELLG
jgi:phosphotransferase family enzyme